MYAPQRFWHTNMIRSAAVLASLVLIVASHVGAAQSPADREQLEQLRRSPGATSLQHPSLHNDSNFIQGRLGRGFILLAAGKRVQNGDTLLASTAQFYEVVIRRPHWPYGWYGLGLAKLELYRLGAGETRSAHQPAGSGWLAGAQSAFERALREEPTFSPAVSALSETVLVDPTKEGSAEALEILRRYEQLRDPDTTTSLALSRLYLARDSFAQARRLAERYLAQGGDTGVALWESARAAFGEGESTAGSRLYYEGAARLTSRESFVLYAEDIGLIADSSERLEFASIPGEVRATWLKGLWSRREQVAGRPAGTRLPEHFRRVQYARRHFATHATLTQYSYAQIYRNAPRGLDDRGVIYIRHGEPDERSNYVGRPGTYPNESWLYFRPEGNLVLHFAAMRNTGFRLIENLTAIVERADTVSPALAAEIYESRAGLDPLYLRLASLYEMEAARARSRVQEAQLVNPTLLQRDRQRIRAAIALGTTTDSDPIDLDRSWSPITQVFGVPSTTLGQAGLLVVIALPAPADLTPILLPGGGAGYVVRLRTTAADDSGRTTLDVDSLVRLRTPRPLEKAEFLTLVRSYTLSVGTQRVRVIVADSAGEHGAVRVLSGVPAVDLSTPNLAMSDLVVGREESGVTWTSPNGTSIPLQPLNAWRTTDAMAINFEVSGLSAGQPYKVRIGIADLGADTTQPPKASVEFDNQASGARELVTQSLGLRSLRPGRYLLTATVSAGDRVIRRERRVTVTAAR